MTTAQSESNPYRLPRTVEPTRYQLVHEPDLEAATFTGSVRIDLQIHDDVQEIVANAIELEITDVVIETAEGTTVSATCTFDETYERVTFHLERPIGIGEAILSANFKGILNDQLHGFYRSTFTDADGHPQNIATTQFESTDARRAFPCWDEPDRKAVYEVTLVVPGDLAAYSNSPISNETMLDDGRRRVEFKPTMKMSTYLVAFVVGPFDATDPVDVDGVPLRVVYPKGKAHLANFGLEIGAFSLRFFTEYFGIAYPGEKLDLVAIPDFAAGAMENLGCVTFRETALLIDPERASRINLERIVDVVAHEIAHMWFGDLVTMGWWEGIWLNEAFATFMEILCTDAFRPQWERWVSFGLEREMSLTVDGLHSTRPIEFEVHSPDECAGMFDILTYQKGGSVLRMLQQYIGDENFRDGVRLYLNRHAYANTVTTDLWDALEDASGQPVREIMNSWILQGGHPIVTFDHGSITQQPFAYGPLVDGATSAIGENWKVPVLARSLADGSTTRVLLGHEPAAVDLPSPVVINAGGSGVYRVAYSSDNVAELAGSLSRLEPLEKATFVNDLWAATLSGKTTVADFLTVATKLGDENEPAVWNTVANALFLINRVVSDSDRAKLQAVTQEILGNKTRELGWDPVDGEGERIPNLRATMIRTLALVGGDREIIETALAHFDADQAARATGGTAINADLEETILDIVGAENRPGDYERVLHVHKHARTPQEEITYLTALADFSSDELVDRTFAMALNETRTQDAPFLIVVALGNRVAGPRVWGHIVENWDTLTAKFPENTHSRMTSSVRMFVDPTLAAEVRSFLTAHPTKSGQQTVLQMLEIMDNNVAFAERIRPTLPEVLTNFVAG